MVKVAWKVINGHGPYAYLQKSVKHPDGTVTSDHIAYLGAMKPGGPLPGKFLTVSGNKFGDYDGQRLFVNPVPVGLKETLSDNALDKLTAIEEQIQAGVSSAAIVLKQDKGKLGATGGRSTDGPKAPGPKPTSQDKGKLGATGGGSADGPKSPGQKPTSEGKKGDHDRPHHQKISAAAQTGQTNGGLAGAFSAVDAQVERLQTLPGPVDVPAPTHQVNVQSYADGLKQQLLSAELAGKIPPTADLEDVKDLVRLAVQSGVIGMEASAAALVAKANTQDRKESIPVVAANIKLALQGKSGGAAGPYQSPAAPSLPLSYHPPASKVVHYAELEKAAASGFAAGGIAGAVTEVRKRARELPGGSSAGSQPAVNVARRRLLARLIDAWITDEVEPNDLPALTRAPLTRALASAATGGMVKFEEKVLAMTTEPSDDQVKYVQSVAGLVKKHLADQLAHDVSWMPEPAPEATALAGGPAPEPTPAVEPPSAEPPMPSSLVPKLSAVPKGSNGKPLISAMNVQKLEQVAATGDAEALDLLAAQIDAKLLAPAKKEALQAAAVALKSQLGASKPAPSRSPGSDPESRSALTAPVSLPEVVAAPSTPAPGMTELAQALQSVVVQKAGQEGSADAAAPAGALTSSHDPAEKNWNALLVQVSGPKGSNQGGLFKHQETGALHYVKWSGSDVRARIEALAGNLYALAGAPAPGIRIIDFNGQTAVMSDWIDDAKAMTIVAMKAHPDVRENFVADAWLANWDVIGLAADNIVLGPDGKAYRIDAGGSLLFRAQGAPKAFPPFVEEHQTLLDQGKNPNSAAVFQGLTTAELLAGAGKVASVTDAQIDAAVDAMNLPKTTDDYKDTEDLPQTLKWRLKKRRDHLVAEITNMTGQEVTTAGQESTGSTQAPRPQPIPVVPPPQPAAVTIGPVPVHEDDYHHSEPSSAPQSPEPPPALTSTQTTMPNVSATNQKKLEQAAASGDVALLEATGLKLSAALKSQAKQVAIVHAVANLKAQLQGMVDTAAENDTGMSEAVENVTDGDIRLPGQSVPDPALVDRQSRLKRSGNKDYDADLEPFGGKQGSTNGALFQDQRLDTLHYVKWNQSETRSKVEALTGALYALADVPVPMQRVIDFKGETAVMSDWLDGATPMTVDELKNHPDILENYAVDAWLANWDVVGTNGVNIVKGPGGKAYRVDLGGALLFRAMGEPKKLPEEVTELSLLQDWDQNPMAAQVFANLTDEQLKAGAEKVGQISDQQINEAVDRFDIPRQSPQYPDSKDIPQLLKTRLKKRRDYLAKEVLNIIDLKQQKAEAAQKQLEELGDTSELKPVTLEVVVEHAPKMTLLMNGKQRRAIQDEVLTSELGKTKGKNASAAVSSTYNSWKGWADSPAGRLMRWATGAMDGTGDRELRRLQKFNEFLVAKQLMTPTTSATQIAEAHQAAESAKGTSLTQGLKVTRKANQVASVITNPGDTHITLYRGWKPIQLEYLQLQDSQVGDILNLDDPPVYSWSLNLSTAKNFGHGSIVTRAEVPIDRLVLTDRMNNTGSFAGENEVLFKGGDEQQMEVLYKL